MDNTVSGVLTADIDKSVEHKWIAGNNFPRLIELLFVDSIIAYQLFKNILKDFLWWPKFETNW